MAKEQSNMLTEHNLWFSHPLSPPKGRRPPHPRVKEFPTLMRPPHPRQELQNVTGSFRSRMSPYFPLANIFCFSRIHCTHVLDTSHFTILPSGLPHLLRFPCSRAHFFPAILKSLAFLIFHLAVVSEWLLSTKSLALPEE